MPQKHKNFEVRAATVANFYFILFFWIGFFFPNEVLHHIINLEMF
jgi:hypothetical protein